MSKNMSVKKDLKCIFNMPQKLDSQFDGGGEVSYKLPPYAPVNVYPVDEYESCPANWMHGSDISSSYFVGVKEDHGMWLDFNECFHHTHDVAIVISIQGINPVTGQKMVAEKALKLEQYHKKCPIHNINFKQDRYCEKCCFKWPGQNYLATTGTPEIMLWLDGFRTPEGKVRQYIFTKDTMKGVASQLIGEERVFSIGLAYYLSKDKKPYTLRPFEEKRLEMEKNRLVWEKTWSDQAKNMFNNKSDNLFAQPMFFSPLHNSQNWQYPKKKNATDPVSLNCNIDTSLSDKGIPICDPKATKSKTSQLVTPVKNLEIGAGALIEQRIYDDPKMMSYWESEPAGMIYINYCDEETQKKILDGGRRADEKDGFLKNIKVGG